MLQSIEWRPQSKQAAFIAGAILLSVASGLSFARIGESTTIFLSVLIALIVFGVVIVGLLGVRALSFVGLSFAFLLLAATNLRVNKDIAYSDVLFVAATALALPSIAPVLEQKLSPELRKYLRGAFLLLAGSLIASLLSSELEDSAIRLVKMTVSVLIVPIGIIAVATSTARLKLLTIFWIVSVAISALVGIIEGPPEYSQRILGLATHQNTLALTCVLAIGPALAFALCGSKIERVIGLVALPICIIGLFESGSRAGLLGSVVTLLVFWVVSRSKAMALAIGVIVISLFGAYLIGYDLPIAQGSAVERLLDSRNQDSEVTESNDERTAKLDEAISMIEERPLIGVGLQEARAAHNVYLQVFSSSGLIGLIGFVIAVTAGLSSLKDKLLISEARQGQSIPLLIVGMSASYAGFLFYEIFGNSLWERFMWAFPVVLICMYTSWVDANQSQLGRRSVG